MVLVLDFHQVTLWAGQLTFSGFAFLIHTMECHYLIKGNLF